MHVVRLDGKVNDANPRQLRIRDRPTHGGKNDLPTQTGQPPHSTQRHVHGMPFLVIGAGTMRHARPCSIRLSSSAFALTSTWPKRKLQLQHAILIEQCSLQLHYRQ